MMIYPFISLCLAASAAPSWLPDSHRSCHRNRWWWPSTPATISSTSGWRFRSEEHTSELQSLMRISYAVLCLKKKKYQKQVCTNALEYDKYNIDEIRQYT